MRVAGFRALRYRIERDGDLSGVVSLPYDQFDDEGSRARYDAHRYHVVRLIRSLPEDDSGDVTAADGEPGHRSAARTLSSWCRDGVIEPDPSPSLYPVRQRFRLSAAGPPLERWACIARVALSPLDSGPIFPHEATFPGTVAERAGLRRLTGADVGLVLMICDDPDGAFDRALSRAAEAAPIASAVDEAGTENDLWRWSDSESIGAVVDALAAARAVIADGHHRYTGALSHWQQDGADPDAPSRWIMAAVVSSASDGLAILPVHRLVRTSISYEASARSGCGFELVVLAGDAQADRVIEACRRALATDADRHAIVHVRRGDGGLECALLTAALGSQDNAAWPDSVPLAWRRLDVSVLHDLLLGPILGSALSGQAEDVGELAFASDLEEVVGAVARGDRASAFLLRPLSFDVVRAAALAGDVLPPKSTNFHPKAIAGLTFHRFADQQP